MDDEAALLTAIAAHPDEDTPRLAYADWLDEHGRPIRAEFIRVQCAVKRLEELPAAEKRPHVPTWQRQNELLERHRHDLLGPLADDLTYFDAVFDRGFVTELTVKAAVFLKHVDAIGGLKPMPRIHVTHADGPHFRPLLARPELGLIETLTVPPGEAVAAWRLPSDGIAHQIVTCNHLGRLEVLELEACQIRDDGLNEIAHATTLPALIELDVSYNEISDEGVRLLVASPLWGRLRRIVLGGNPISDVGAERLAEAADGSRLENLNLRFTAVGPDGFRALLRRYGGRVDLF
jgi:uncharacterized protein (TIGR02996 family)